MAVNVSEVRSMSDYEIVFYARKFSEEYLVESGWNAWARKELYRRYHMILEKDNSSKESKQATKKGKKAKREVGQ